MDDTVESYWQRATGGVFGPGDLAAGQQLLIEVGFLLERGDTLVPMPELAELLEGTAEDAAAILSARWAAAEVDSGQNREEAEQQLLVAVDDPEAREELLLALGRRFDDAARRRVGEIGEELVVRAAREELRRLGRADLARAVRRVSLISDQLGYDVTAPRLAGPPRRLEVKATNQVAERESITIYLSRNEADVARRVPEWALVICEVEDVETRDGRLLGWCAHRSFEADLPSDTDRGRWEQVRIELDPSHLVPGLPSAAL